jgi:hypothetical protein
LKKSGKLTIAAGAECGFGGAKSLETPVKSAQKRTYPAISLGRFCFPKRTLIGCLAASSGTT